MVTPKRRIKRARIQFLSLCKAGRNRCQAVFKSETAALVTVEAIAKMEEDGKLTAVVSVPGLTFSDGDLIDDGKVVEEACHNFITEMVERGGGIDVDHDFEPLGSDDVQLCENFIIQKGDPRFADFKVEGKRVDPTGGWAVIIELKNEDLRKSYRTGAWDGISMAGPALVEPITKSFPDALADRLGDPSTELFNMDETKLAELFAGLAKSITDGVGAKIDELKKSLDTEPEQGKETKVTKSEPEAEVIEFEGDPTKPEDVRAHQAKLRMAKVDWNDPKSVEAHLATLEKSEGDEGASEGETKNGRKIKALEAEIANLRKGESGQGTDGNRVDSSEGDSEEVQIQKSRERAREAGKRLERRRGRVVAES